MVKYTEEILVLRAKVINGRFCSTECPFLSLPKKEGTEIRYTCSLFGRLTTEFESINIMEDDEDESIVLDWAELPVRSKQCTKLSKRR